MSTRFLEDPAVVSLNKPAGAEGVGSLTKYMKDCTGEVRNLLMNECDVIYECRYCRAMFRSIIHFVSHKRSHCRGTHEALSTNSKIAKKAFDDELERIERENRSKDSTKRNTTLRQRNLVSVLNKRSADVTVPIPGTTEVLNLHTLPRICKEVPVTTFQDGVQKIVDCPASLAHKEGVDSDKVVLVVPQDHSSKYAEMQLRNRREAATKQVVSKMTTLEEREALARCQDVAPFLFDVGPNRCRAANCGEVKNFENILAMAYHIAIKHVSATESDPKTCLLCDEMFNDILCYREHLLEEHADIKRAHVTFRSKADGEKKKYIRKNQRDSRNRSMSPPPGDVPILEAENVKDDPERLSVDTDEEPPTLQCEVSSENGSDVPARRLRPRSIQEALTSKFKKRITRNNSASNIAAIPPSTRDTSNTGDSPTDEEGEVALLTLKNESKSEKYPENKFAKDITRVTRFLVQKAENGQLQASLSEMISSGEVSRATSGRSTPYNFGLQNETKVEAVTPPVTARNSMNDSAMEPDSDDASLALLKEKMNARENVEQQTQINERKSEEQQIQVNAHESEELQSQQSIMTESSSPGTDTEADPDAPPVVRQRSARTRKRPEWMTQDYVLNEDKDLLPVPLKKMRGNESSPPSRNSPAIDNASPQKLGQPNKAPAQKKPLMPIRSQVVYRTIPKTVEPKADVVLPAPRNIMARTPKPDKEEIAMSQYTPRARKLQGETYSVSSPAVPESPGSSRRKQDMSQVAEKQIKDLATVPVFLSHNQKELFFSGLKLMNGEQAPLNEADAKKMESSAGPFQCEYCHEIVPNLKDGRRHMVSHIRVMRLRCKLCRAGAFFCTDMRAHLMDRACPQLHMAPDGMVKAGFPCMTKLEADELTEIADTSSPGRVMYTSGEIVSSTNRVPYFPDPVIEEKILGQGRLVAGRNSNTSA